MDFTLPLRSALKRGLSRRESKLELRAAFERDAEPKNHDQNQHPAQLESSGNINVAFALPLRPASGRGLAQPGSRLDLRVAYPGAPEPKMAEQILRTARSQQQLAPRGTDRSLRTTKSRAHLAPISTDRINKPSLRKRATIANLRSIPEVEAPRVVVPRVEAKSTETEEATAEDWAHVEEFIQEKEAMKKIDRGMNVVDLSYMRKAEDILEAAAEKHRGQTTEEILQTLTVDAVTIIARLNVSFKSALTEVGVAADVTILVNELPDFAAFSSQMHKQHSAAQGMVLLRTREPERWLFRSRTGKIDADELATYGGQEYSRACLTTDVGVVYEQFRNFLFTKGQHKAGEGIQKARSKMKWSKAMRKGVAEFDLAGRKREFTEVHVPDAVFVYGHVHIFI